MEFIYENNIVMTYAQHSDFTRGLPFYGEKGDFNFVMGRSQFTPGISIKILPLSDLSRNADVGITEFQQYVNTINNMFKPGDRIRGIEMNSMLNEDDEEGTQVVGKFDKIKVDYENKQIRAFVKDPSTLKSTEVYPGTMERLMESASYKNKDSYLIPNFNKFIEKL
tara:strand:- start:6152 stop:6649 length:498 start_codon:yes stop_codon:yes gene_type:complete